MRVFLDTNVLASSIATRGLCAELFESVVNEHELLTCEPVLRELKRVLSNKFHLPDSIIKAQVQPTIKFKDADDIAILACVIASEADVFVTGDKALLELGAIENIPILSPRQTWQQFSGLSNDKKPK